MKKFLFDFNKLKNSSSRFPFASSSNFLLSCMLWLSQFMPVAEANNGFYFADNKGGMYFLTADFVKLEQSISNVISNHVCEGNLLNTVSNATMNLIGSYCPIGKRASQTRIHLYAVNGTQPDDTFIRCFESYLREACSVASWDIFKIAFPLGLAITISIFMLMYLVFKCTRVGGRVPAPNVENPLPLPRNHNVDSQSTAMVSPVTMEPTFNDRFVELQEKVNSFEADISSMKQVILPENKDAFTQYVAKFNKLKIKLDKFQEIHKDPIEWSIMNAPITIDTGITYDRDSFKRYLERGNKLCPVSYKNTKHTINVLPAVNIDRKNQIDDGLKKLECKFIAIDLQIKRLISIAAPDKSMEDTTLKFKKG